MTAPMHDDLPSQPPDRDRVRRIDKLERRAHDLRGDLADTEELLDVLRTTLARRQRAHAHIADEYRCPSYSHQYRCELIDGHPGSHRACLDDSLRACQWDNEHATGRAVR